jgi:hypothetical protein
MTSLSNLLLANRCKIPATLQQLNDLTIRAGAEVAKTVEATGVDHPAWNNLYYGVTPRKADYHLAALAKDFPEVAALLKPAVIRLIVDLAAQDVARAEKKAALLARRADKAVKASKKKALGVDLTKVGGTKATEATFAILVAALEPLRAAYEVQVIGHITNIVEDYAAKLAKFGNDYNAAFTVQHTHCNRVYIPNGFFQWFTASGRIATIHADVTNRIAKAAKEQATDEFLSFAAKMTGKIDTAANGVAVAKIDATSSGRIWEQSTTSVTLTNGTTQVWHTQSIVNTSVLGNMFNQWPTRRTD